jgi:hypothetical protein
VPYPWITTFILLDKMYFFITVFTYEKALVSSYEKNVVNAAFPPYAERIFKMRKCDAFCFWKFKS